jgi:FkbM family methyltransferase
MIFQNFKIFVHSFLLLIFISRQYFFHALFSLSNSKAQLRQDIFALSITNFKKSGFFVEFGATDGIYYSNTFLLEKKYNWKGILSEPAKSWHRELMNNRSSLIDNRCVWKRTGDFLEFNEAKDPALSTVEAFNDFDDHAHLRADTKKYSVETISLKDLLDFHNAPSNIDLLTIDTEGSEYEILNNFDFSKYSFNVICCEHNYSENREKIFSLLTNHGYKRVYTFFSRFDDWYIKTN